ncbi:hypothetical protein B0H11DRAFT_938758 [Mycena galericulata]|nr:hypothetical protein B0H11DRAFT_938758 [Mycena galericulata]
MKVTSFLMALVFAATSLVTASERRSVEPNAKVIEVNHPAGLDQGFIPRSPMGPNEVNIVNPCLTEKERLLLIHVRNLRLKNLAP